LPTSRTSRSRARRRGTGGDERGILNDGGLDAAPFARHFRPGVAFRVPSMLRRVVLSFGLVAAALALAGAGDGRRHQINPIPFSHEPCSVLSHRPCTPTYCSPLQRGPCIPEIFYPNGENLQVTIQTVPAKEDEDKYVRPDHDLDTIGDLFAALRSCWSPPPADVAREGMQMSVRFSFKKSGEMIGPPRMTFSTAGTPADVRETHQRLARRLHSPEIHRWSGRRAGRTPDRDPLCRQSRSRQTGRQAVGRLLISARQIFVTLRNRRQK